MHRRSGSSATWWRRLTSRHQGQGQYGLSSDWTVVDGPTVGTEFAVGPGGAFLLDRRRVAPRETARIATEFAGHLTARTGTYVTVHPVIVEDNAHHLRTDQPHDATIVTPIVLGNWLASHPTAFDLRQVTALRHALVTD